LVGAKDAVQVRDAAHGGVGFRSPSSGRFYLRPAPDKPLFVEVGAAIVRGQTIGLLEVMKTFNRIVFGGDGMPDQATVRRVIPADGADVSAGDALLELDD
jgi:acetyl-CoA carboxylase biotin carboxyl carrier protein